MTSEIECTLCTDMKQFVNKIQSGQTKQRRFFDNILERTANRETSSHIHTQREKERVQGNNSITILRNIRLYWFARSVLPTVNLICFQMLMVLIHVAHVIHFSWMHDKNVCSEWNGRAPSKRGPYKKSPASKSFVLSIRLAITQKKHIARRCKRVELIEKKEIASAAEPRRKKDDWCICCIVHIGHKWNLTWSKSGMQCKNCIYWALISMTQIWANWV